MHQIGQNVAQPYAEDQAVQYTNLAIGRRSFSAGGYIHSGNYITNQFLQDAAMAAQVKAEFIPSQARAIAKAMEEEIMKQAGPDGQSGQTEGDYNMLNGARHRMIGSGTNNSLGIQDFNAAALALDMANVPQAGRVAIIDQASLWEFNKLIAANHLNQNFNQQWADLVLSGGASAGTVNSFVFKFNLFGFDIYTNTNLHKRSVAETIDGTTIQSPVENMLFSMDGSMKPFAGTMRQAPKVDSEYNKDYQREEYVTTARFGHTLWRPNNMVTILTDDKIVY